MVTRGSSASRVGVFRGLRPALRPLHYAGKSFQSLSGGGSKTNLSDVATPERCWISRPRQDGADALYATNIRTTIDEDVREEYWSTIRNKPGKNNIKTKQRVTSKPTIDLTN